MIRIVVAGINTEVGKTVVSAIVTEALDGYYWKSVQCGLPTDKDWVEGNLSKKDRCFPSNFSFHTPCSPHLAARKEAMHIEARTLLPPVSAVPLVIEGTGGLLVPLNETETWADAAIHWNACWILVHRHYLGSLNHFALTVEAMKQRNIPLLGVIFNGEGDASTEEMLLQKADTSCLGRLAWQEQITPTTIRRIAEEWKLSLLSALGL
jgi:dethiobiotin synthetase